MIDNLRCWCHKILPLVYDDSLSYYEVLCKTSAKLNEVITSTNGLLETWDRYKNDIDKAFGDYKKVIQDEFEQLASTMGNEFNGYKAELNKQVADSFTAQDEKLAAQDTKLAEMQTNVNNFIEQYNTIVANIPDMVVTAVNDWMANTANYDNVIADLAGSIQGLKHYATVSALASTRYADITPGEVCVCENYYDGDGVFTIWEIQSRQPYELPDTFGVIDMAKTASDPSTYRRAVLRSPYTSSTLGIPADASARLAELCKYANKYSPLIVDRDLTADLSADNTTGKTLQLIGDQSKRPTVTLTGDNHFIDSFDNIKVMHNKSTITHSTGTAIHFKNSLIWGDRVTIKLTNLT